MRNHQNSIGDCLGPYMTSLLDLALPGVLHAPCTGFYADYPPKVELFPSFQ